jgi:NAD(P)-dependent dehydrogenase (short-subunit alcohol dehydrogenase family)
LSWDRLETLAAEIDKAGGITLVVEADISDRNQAEAAAQQAVERFGRYPLTMSDGWGAPFALAIDDGPASPEVTRRPGSPGNALGSCRLR